MYSKILVALDESQLSRQAFQHSLSLAQVFDAKLMLLNVVSPQEAEWQFVVANKLDYLRSLVDEATQAGVATKLVQEIGQPEQQICESAKDWQADLIVIGSHGRKGLNELIMGSVSNYVSHHVPCDVLLVHQQV